MKISKTLDIEEYFKNIIEDNNKYITDVCLFDRVLNKINIHNNETSTTIDFMKRIKKIILQAKSKIYIGDNCMDQFIPCDKYLDNTKECTCSLENNDIAGNKHHNGLMETIDVYIKNDRWLAKPKWAFVIDTPQVVKSYQILDDNKISKELQNTTPGFDLKCVPDITYIITKLKYLNKERTEKIIQNWIMKYFKRDLEVIWIENIF